MTALGQLRKRCVETFSYLRGKAVWASLPTAAAANQVWDIPNLFWFCLVWAVVRLDWHRHLERMEDKRHDFERDQADKERTFKREVLDREAAEAENKRAFDREMTDKLFTHARRTKQPFTVRLPDGSVFQVGSMSADSPGPTSRKLAA